MRFLSLKWSKKIVKILDNRNAKKQKKIFDKIIKKANENKVSVLRRNHDFYTALFITSLVSLILVVFDLIRDVIIYNDSSLITMVITMDIIAIVSLGIITFAFYALRDSSSWPMILREENNHLSNKKAYEFLKELLKIE